ncbi:MAG: hypothetical protein HY554_13455, partial [Elusimicrobia bacterium]|nr:hypothetical protein [Elusimicrobiota bacterium]
GGAGGGAIYLIVRDTATIDGEVSANGLSSLSGGAGTGSGGGGSGGSVVLLAGAVTGAPTGVIRAAGGTGASVTGGVRGGGGGGGRIAAYGRDNYSFSASNIDANKGSSTNPGVDGTISSILTLRPHQGLLSNPKQVDNDFLVANLPFSDPPAYNLFAFELLPSSGPVSVASIEFDLSEVDELNAASFTDGLPGTPDIVLGVDHDPAGDIARLDVTETRAVGGPGALTLAGDRTGTIRFSEPFLVEPSTGMRLVLAANLRNMLGGSNLVVNLAGAKIDARWGATTFRALKRESVVDRSSHTFFDGTPPQAITSLTALTASASGFIQLSWSAPGDNGNRDLLLGASFYLQYTSVTAYAVDPLFWSTNSAQIVISTTDVSPGSTRYYDVTGLKSPGTTYYFALWTKDFIGNLSALGRAATAQTLSPPETPAAPSLTGVFLSSVSLQWPGAHRTDYYEVSVTTLSSFSRWLATATVPATFLFAGAVSPSATAFTDLDPNLLPAGLPYSTTHYFRLRAVNGSGASQFSSTVSAVTLPPPMPQPRPPSFPAVAVASFTVQWASGPTTLDAIAAGTSYYVQVSTNPDFRRLWSSSATFNLEAAFGAGAAPPALVANTTYYARATAYLAYVGTWSVVAQTTYTLLGSTVTLADSVSVEATSATPPTSVWQNHSSTFQFRASFGVGSAMRYLWALDNSPTYAFTGAEAPWSGGLLTTSPPVPSGAQPWYFHAAGVNWQGVVGPSRDFGPYYFEDAAPTETGASFRAARGGGALMPSFTAGSDEGYVDTFAPVLQLDVQDADSGLSQTFSQYKLARMAGVSVSTARFAGAGLLPRQAGGLAGYFRAGAPALPIGRGDFSAWDAAATTAAFRSPSYNSITAPLPASLAGGFRGFWVGYVYSVNEGSYTFYADFDDGGFISVNNTLVRWDGTAPGASGLTAEHDVYLSSNSWVPIVIGVFDDGSGGYGLNLQWKEPGDGFPSPIPLARLAAPVALERADLGESYSDYSITELQLRALKDSYSPYPAVSSVTATQLFNQGLQAYPRAAGGLAAYARSYGATACSTGLEWFTGGVFGYPSAFQASPDLSGTWAGLPTGGGNGGFAALWVGRVKTTREAGAYNFVTTNDGSDSSFVWVAGTWLRNPSLSCANSPGPSGGPVTLAADTWYPIVVGAFDIGGSDGISLQWRPPLAAGYTGIPAANLDPGNGFAGESVWAEYSTNAGASWNRGPRAQVTGNTGAFGAPGGPSGGDDGTAAATIKAYGIAFATSANSSGIPGATNQVRFVFRDRAGNTRTGSPYAVMVDTIAPVATPLLVYPDTGPVAGLQPVLSWSLPPAVAGQSLLRYQVQVSLSEADFSAPVHENLLVPQNGADFYTWYRVNAPLAPLAWHYWRVRSVRRDTLQVSPWSQVRRFFTVGAAAPVASLFRTYNSTGGVIAEDPTRYNDLSSPVTGQVTLQDADIGLSTVAPAGLIPGTASLWRFDTTAAVSATLWQDEATGVSGVPSGALEARPLGRFRDGAWFDGASAALNAGGVDPTLVDNFTVEFWANPAGPAGQPNLFGDFNSGNWCQFPGGNGPFPYVLAPSDYGGGSEATVGIAVGRAGVVIAENDAGTDCPVVLSRPVALNGWNHIAVVYRARVPYLYVNGVQQGAAGQTNAGSPNAYLVRQFGDAGTWGRYSGLLDEVRILSYAATAEEIAAHAAGIPYRAEYSKDAGATWTSVQSTQPVGPLPYVKFSGAGGSKSPETLKLFNMDLALSTSPDTGNRGTNQVRFVSYNLAGSSAVAGPYAVIVDSVIAKAIPYALDPRAGAPVNSARPTLVWGLPSGVQEAAIQAFEVEVSTRDDFSLLDLPIQTGIATGAQSFKPASDVPGAGVHYWRVRSRSYINQASVWSATGSFVIGSAPPAIQGFQSFDSTQGARAEAEPVDLLFPVTTQLLVQDAVVGLATHTALGVSSRTVALYRLEGDGNDASGLGHNASAVGVAWVPGRLGQGASLNGSNFMNVSGPATAFDVSRITVEAWVKVPDPSGSQNVASRTDPGCTQGFRLSIEAGQARFGIGGAAAAQGGAIGAGAWHHVAGTYDSQKIRVYVDGALAQETAFAGALSAPGQGFFIGEQLAGCGNRLNGAVDEVRVLGYAASPELIARDYASGLPYLVQVSTDGGANWTEVVSTWAAAGDPSVRLGGPAGSVSPEWLRAVDLTLAPSLTAATGAGATNQARFAIRNRAGVAATSPAKGVITDVASPIARPAPEGPIGLARVLSATPELAWSVSPGAAPGDVSGYTVYLGDTSDLSTAASVAGVPGSPADWTGPALAPQTTYYWRVGTVNPLGFESARDGARRVVLTTASFSQSGLNPSGVAGVFPACLTNGQLGEACWDHGTTVAPPGTLVVDLGAGNARPVVRLRVWRGAGPANDAVYRVERSVDGTAPSWVAAAPLFRPSRAGWNDIAWKSAGAYRFWRLSLVRAPASAAASYDELELYEAAPAVDPGAFVYIGPALVPSVSDFRSFGSSAGAIGENQFNGLASGVTVQLAVQDAVLGLASTSIGSLAQTRGFWRLDDGAGASLRDSSGRGEAGTLVGGAWAAGDSCRRGKCLELSGVTSGDRLVLPAPTLGVSTQPWTVSLWVRPAQARGVLVHLRDVPGATGATIAQPLLGFTTSGHRLVAGSWDGATVEAPAPGGLPVGTWSHLAETWSPTAGLLLYINGQVAASNPAATTYAGSGGPMYLWVGSGAGGTGSVESARDFAGRVDDVRVRDQAATQAELADEYARGVGYYAEVSTDAGASWRPVLNTAPPAPYVTLSGVAGSTAPQLLKAIGLDLAFSTSAQTGDRATNQVKLHVGNAAGGFTAAGPFAVIVDTVVALAIPEPIFPLDGEYIRTVVPELEVRLPRKNYSDIAQYRFDISADPNDFSGAYTDFGGARIAIGPAAGLVSGATYYWRSYSQNLLGRWSASGATASFRIDDVAPTVAAFRSLNRAGSLVAEGGINDLESGVTAQLVVQDAIGGLANTRTLGAVGDTLLLYHFDEGAGASVADLSGAGHPGAVNGPLASAWSSPGLLNYGSSLYNGGGAVFVNAGPNITRGGFPVSSMTFQAWIQMPDLFQTAPGGRRCLACKTDASDSDFSLYAYSADGDRVTALEFRSTVFGHDVRVPLPRPYLAASWHQVAFSIALNTGRLTLYSDGVPLYAADGSGSAVSPTRDLLIGASLSGEYWNGVIDEVRIVQRTLSDAAVQADYDQTHPFGLPFSVELSTLAGASWQVLSATAHPVGSDARVVEMSGGQWQSDATVTVYGLQLAKSLSAQTGALATNQVRFRVFDRAGNPVVSAPYGIIVDTVSSVALPQPVSPPDGAWLNAAQPTLRWNLPKPANTRDIATYHAQITANPAGMSAGASFPSLLVASPTAPGLSWTVDSVSLSEGVTYYWQAQSRDLIGQDSVFGATASFRIDTTLPAALGFASLDSQGALVSESQVNDLSAGVTVQLTVQDSASGLSVAQAYPFEATPATVGLWHFDEGAGTQAPDSSGAYTASFQGPAGWGSGRFGGGLVFNGNGGRVALAKAGLDSMAALQFWFKCSAPTDALVGKGPPTAPPADSGYYVAGGCSSLRLVIPDAGGTLHGDAASMPVPSDGQWHFYTGTYDGTEIRQYLDGVPKTAFPRAGAVVPNADPLYVGPEYDRLGGKGRFAIDELRVLSSTLSASQIAEEYRRTLNYRVEYSTTQGSLWSVVQATWAPAGYGGPWLSFGGPHGATAASTLRVNNLTFERTLSTMSVGAAATNQVKFTVSDVAGNTLTAGPYAVIADTIAPRATPIPVSPTFGTFVAQSQPTLSWQLPPGIRDGDILSYHVRVSVDPQLDSGSLSVNTAGILTKSFQVPLPLPQAATFYWQVRALDISGIYTQFSATGSFIIDAAPPSALLASFVSYDSSMSAVLESLPNDLLTGVTAQISVVDTIAGLSIPSPPSPTSPVLAEWPLDEASGDTAEDVTGNGYDATPAPAPEWAVGRIGAARRVTSDSSALQASLGIPGLSAGGFTFEAWVYPEAVAAGSLGAIMGQGDLDNQAYLGLPSGAGGVVPGTPDGRFSFWMTDSGGQTEVLSGTVPVTLAAWHHVAATYGGGAPTLRLFVDGVLVAEKAFTSSSGALPFMVGRHARPNHSFQGLIDHPRVVGRALSIAEIGQNFRRGAASAYFAEVSTDTGASWQRVAQTFPWTSTTPYVATTGVFGSTSAARLQARNLGLTRSLSTLTGAAGTNQVRFTIYDLAGSAALLGPYSVIVDTIAPVAVPRLDYPPPGTFIRFVQPTFRWSLPLGLSPAEIASYHVQVASNAAMAAPRAIDDVLVPGSELLSFLNLSNGTTYYWRVRSKDRIGIQSGFSAVSSFRIDRAAPSAAAFSSFDSGGQARAQAAINDLASPVTAQLALSDSLSGLAKPSAPRDQPATLLYWHLDELSGGAAVDASGQGNDATLEQGPVRTNGRIGPGMAFDGVDDYAQGAAAATLAGDFTFEAWVKPATLAQNGRGAFMGQHAGTGQMYLGLGGPSVSAPYAPSRFNFWLRDSAGVYGVVSSTYAPVPGLWYHVAGVYQAGAMKLYVNGALQSAKAFLREADSGSAGFGGTIFFAGRSNTAINDGFNGVVDEIRVVASALTDDQILQDALDGSTPPFWVEVSTNAGATWLLVDKTYPATPGAPYVELTGEQGGLTEQELKVYNLDLVESESAGIGAAGKNQLRFYVHDLAQNQLLSGPYSIIVDSVAALARPVPLSPADWALNPSSASTFSWAVAPLGSIRDYEVEVAFDSLFADPALPAAVTSSQAFTAGGLIQGTTFYWRVRARTLAGGLSPYSSSYAVIIDTIAPHLSAYTVIASSGGALGENQWGTLLAGVTAQVTVQQSGVGARGLDVATGTFFVEASTNAGKSWRTISSTYELAAATEPYVSLTGSSGTLTAQTLTVYNLGLIQSTSTLVSTLATNQLRFSATSMAGRRTTQTFAVLVDTTPPGAPAVTSIASPDEGLLLVQSSAASDPLSGLHALPYEVQVSTDGFSSVLESSGWVAASSHTFSSLEHGNIYSTRVRARDLLLNVSTFSSAGSFNLANRIELAATDIAPAAALQGAVVGMLKLDVYNAGGATPWESLRLRSLGTRDQDVVEVLVFADANADGIFSPPGSATPDVQVTPAGTLFSGGQATLGLSPAQTVTPSTQTFFLALKLGNLSLVGGSIGLSIEARSAFSPIFAQASFPINSTLSRIEPGPAVLTLTPQDILPPTIPPGSTNVGLLRILAQTDQYTAEIGTFTVTLTTGTDTDYSGVKVFRDDGDGVFDPARDSLVSAGSDKFQGKAATVTLTGLTTLRTVTPTLSVFFLAVDVSAGAPEGNPAAFSIPFSTSVRLGSSTNTVSA